MYYDDIIESFTVFSGDFYKEQKKNSMYSTELDVMLRMTEERISFSTLRVSFKYELYDIHTHIHSHIINLFLK